MGDGKNVQGKYSVTMSEESQLGECDSFWLVSGPPYDPRDYMISPSSSSSCVTRDDSTDSEKQYVPCDVRINEKYILDSRGALNKLVELVRNGVTQPFKGRIKALIAKYLSGCCNGFTMDDIPFVVEIIEYFALNKNENPEFTDYVKDLVCAAKNPPVVAKSSDILKSKEYLTDYFTILGVVLATFEEEEIQMRVLEAIEFMISMPRPPDLPIIKSSVCHEAVEESFLPYVLAVLMETVSLELYILYLDIIIQIILVSAKAGYAMIQVNILNFLLWRLNYCTVCSLSGEKPRTAKEENVLKEYYSLLEKSSYAIWGLLTIICKCDVDVPCPSEDAMLSLRIVFERESMKKSQKAVVARNNLAGIAVKLCSAFGEKLPVFQSGLSVDMAVMAVATEMGSQGTWVESCKLGTKKEDFILKKLMLLGCCLVTKDSKCVETLKAFKVIEGVLKLVDPTVTAPWIPSQFITLFYTALRTLSLLVPLMPEVFVLSGGTTKILSAMKWFMKKDFDRVALLEILKMISIIVMCPKCTCVIDDILAKDGVKFFLDLCFYIIGLESIKLEDQEKLIRVFMVLEKMLSNRKKYLVRHGHSCTSIAIKLLLRILKDSSNDSKWCPQLLVSLGGFIWETIAWCALSRSSFIDQGGIFILLDIIELSSYPVQMLFLGILVEMTDGEKNVSYLNTWRGKNGYGVLDAMIDVWRKEEIITKVQRTTDGIIKDVHLPLMTEEQWFMTHQIRGAHNYSPSIAEMSCSVRPKIYAMFQFLQKKYLHLTSLSECFYSLYLKNVRPAYQVYIPLIENYFTMKMGEIWFEVLRDATLSGVLPTADDGKALSTLLDEKNKWSLRIKTMQEEIALIQRMGRDNQEKQLYDLLKSNKFSYSLEVLGELDYVARTSQKRFQLEKKRKQIEDVENSLKALKITPDVQIHRTFVYKTNTTCFSGNYVKIKSEKEVAENEDNYNVSSDESNDVMFESSDM